jgi:hypothetical protein
MLKLIVMLGRELDGFSLTGSRGRRASPTSDRQKKVTMTVKAEKVYFLFILFR